MEHDTSSNDMRHRVLQAAIDYPFFASLLLDEHAFPDPAERHAALQAILVGNRTEDGANIGGLPPAAVNRPINLLRSVLVARKPKPKSPFYRKENQ